MLEYKRHGNCGLTEDEEKQLIMLYKCGFHYIEIAQHFHIGETTAKRYVRQAKLTCKDRLPIRIAIELIKEAF